MFVTGKTPDDEPKIKSEIEPGAEHSAGDKFVWHFEDFDKRLKTY